jgi:hypothetical protein
MWRALDARHCICAVETASLLNVVLKWSSVRGVIDSTRENRGI